MASSVRKACWGGGGGATCGGDEGSPPSTVSKHKWGKRTNKATTLATSGALFIVNSGIVRQSWETLQKLLTKLGNQTTMTEKVQLTQKPKQAISDEIGQASCSELEVSL